MARYIWLCNGLYLAIAVGTVVGVIESASAADLQRGALLFQTCAACHSVLGNGIGPDISQIFGAPAASQAGFKYSEALKRSGLVWDERTLRAFVSNPQALVKGTAMTFPGYSSPADVEDVVAYLKNQKQ